MSQSQNDNPNTLPNFHAVEYMREVRSKHAEEYKDNQQRYLENARNAMEAFMQLLKEPAANVGFRASRAEEYRP